MWWVTLFLYLSLTQVLPQELDVGDVGISDIKGAGWSRIVSGWDARPGQHPHQALLRLINFHGTVRSCGGTIIHKEWLLTVAHCPAGYTTIVIRAGLIEINKPEMMLESTKVYIHPTFNVSNAMSAQVNDIAMIKLPTPLEYSRNLRAIRIKPISEAFIDYKDVVFYSSGFGRIWTQGDRPDHLQWVYLKGISNEECVGYYNSRSISDNSLCAIGYNETTQSICTGDNGGPLVHVSADGEPTLVAIISFVADSQRGCHSGYPGVFTRTAPFHPWFKEITGIDFENLHEETVPAEYVPTAYVESYDNARSGSRIVSGWDAQPGQHPHQAHLRMISFTGLVSSCGGSIIHREWVVTAAHCSAAQRSIVVRAGGVLMASPDVTVDTAQYHLYPTFDESRPRNVQTNDISLLKLARPLEYSRNIRPIRIQPLSDAFRNYANEIVYASGFGRTWTEGHQPTVLQWVYLRGVSNVDCAFTYGTTFVTENTVCARFFNVTSQSICQGDSGGPLVHVSSDGVPTLIGVSSFVPAPPHGCHSGFPGAFIRLAPFLSWFEEITGIDFNDLNEDEEVSTLPPATPAPTLAPTTLEPTTVTVPTPEPEEEESEEEENKEESEEDDTSEENDSSEEDDSSEESDSNEEDNDDKELSELLKKLEIKVKVNVKLSKHGQKKIK